MNQNINRFFAIAMAGTIIFTGSNLTGLTAQAKEANKVQTVAGAGALFTEAINGQAYRTGKSRRVYQRIPQR